MSAVSVTDATGRLQSERVADEARRIEDFKALFEQQLPYVWKTLRRLGVAESELSDVAHDVFVIVVRRLPDFDPSRPIKPWLFGIAYRVARDHRRLARHRSETQAEVEVMDPTPPVDEQMALAERQRLVRAALQTLDDERRAVFILGDLDETPMPDVAVALGIPLNTAYSRLRLAREDMRRAVTRLAAQRPTLPRGNEERARYGSQTRTPGRHG